MVGLVYSEGMSSKHTAATITKIRSHSAPGTHSTDQHIWIDDPETGTLIVSVARFEGRIVNVNLDLPNGRRIHNIGGHPHNLMPGTDEYDSTTVRHWAEVARKAARRAAR